MDRLLFFRHNLASKMTYNAWLSGIFLRSKLLA